MRGPNYEWRDLAYWGGLILGMGASYQGLVRMGVDNQFVRLIVSIAIGVGVGFMCERAFTHRPSNPYDDTSGFKDSPDPYDHER